MTPPEVSVVICTRNRARALEATLESLTRTDSAAEASWEVLVVDNGSEDGARAVAAGFAERLPLRVIEEATVGLSHARNRGIDEAQGRTIVWIDDDVLVPTGWLEAWLAGLRRYPDASFFGAGIRVRFEVEPPEWVRAGWPWLGSLFAERALPTPGGPIEAAYLPFGANFAIRTKVQREHRYDPTLGRVGGGLGGGEEVVLLGQLLQTGHEGRWVAGAGLDHVIGAERVDLRRLRRQIRAGARQLQPVPIRSSDGAPMTTAAMRRRWLRLEARWRIGRVTAKAERWVDDFVAASTWLGRLDRRLDRQIE